METLKCECGCEDFIPIIGIRIEETKRMIYGHEYIERTPFQKSLRFKCLQCGKIIGIYENTNKQKESV